MTDLTRISQLKSELKSVRNSKERKEIKTLIIDCVMMTDIDQLIDLIESLDAEPKPEPVAEHRDSSRFVTIRDDKSAATAAPAIETPPDPVETEEDRERLDAEVNELIDQLDLEEDEDPDEKPEVDMQGHRIYSERQFIAKKWVSVADVARFMGDKHPDTIAGYCRDEELFSRKKRGSKIWQVCPRSVLLMINEVDDPRLAQKRQQRIIRRE